MSKSSKVILLIVAVCILFGGVMAGVGFALGASKQVQLSDGIGVEVGGDEVVTDTIKLDDFDTLELDVATVPVYIEEGDSLRLEYKAQKMNVPEVTQEGTHLIIRQPDSVSILQLLSEDQYYRLIMPKSDKVISGSIEFASGKFVNEIMNFDGKIDFASGKLEMQDVYFNGKINFASGSAELKKVTGEELNIDMASGKFDTEKCDFQKVKYDTSSGAIELDLMNSADDYNFELSAASGNISVDGKDVDDEYNVKSEAPYSILGDSASGNVEITFHDGK